MVVVKHVACFIEVFRVRLEPFEREVNGRVQRELSRESEFPGRILLEFQQRGSEKGYLCADIQGIRPVHKQALQLLIFEQPVRKDHVFDCQVGDIGVELPLVVAERGAILAMHVKQNHLGLSQIEDLLENLRSRATLPATAVPKHGEMFGEELGSEYLHLKLLVVGKATQREALGVAGTSEQLVKTPKDRLEI